MCESPTQTIFVVVMLIMVGTGAFCAHHLNDQNPCWVRLVVMAPAIVGMFAPVAMLMGVYEPHAFDVVFAVAVAAQLLELEMDSPELTEYTQVIIHEADRLQSLVDRLLAPHRRPHTVGDVNIHEVCERVRSLILAEFPRGLAVERDYDTSIPEFHGDREQLIQAVLNIAHNATQVLGDRILAGDATIQLRTRIARQATFGKRRFRLALELHIQDNGPGVPEAIRDRIFHPLVSGRDGGSGLGLTLAQTFVQQHNGTIECDSQPGRTVFKLLIPLP